MADSGTVPSQTPPHAGPTVAPPPLPLGWIAQWDPNTKRYYFVQPATGTTTWDVPTSSATSTPAQAQSPYTPPVNSYNPQQAYQDPSHNQQYNAQPDPVTTSRGGPLGQLGGLAQGFLGGGKQGGHGSSGGMGGKLALANQLLAGGKQGGSSGHGGHGGHGSSGSGLMGLAGGLLGGKNKQHGSGGHSSGGLLGMAGGLASGLLNSKPGATQHKAPDHSNQQQSFNQQYGTQPPQHQQHQQPSYGGTQPPYGQQFPPQGQYGTPPPGQYQQAGQYGAPTPPTGQYQSPPPQGYGAHTPYGQTPVGQQPPPPAGQYGAPPPPPGQYGAPPPPPGQYNPGAYGAPPPAGQQPSYGALPPTH